METQEIFKDIVGYEGYYQISNYGNVKSLSRIIINQGRETNIRERILKPKIHNYYKVVSLNKESIDRNYFIHRLIAKAFIQNHKNKPYINHINGIRSDNRIENLEWCTHLENMQHAFRTGLTNNSGEHQTNSILKEYQIPEIKELLKTGLSQYKIGAMYNVSRGCILGIHLGNTWKHLL